MPPSQRPDHPTGGRRFVGKQPSVLENSNADGPIDHPLPSPDDDLDVETDHSAPRNRLWEQETRDLFKHRAQGHATYHPACPQCIGARGVTKHRRKQGERGIEVQADFAVFEDFRVLCLVETSSGSLGYIYMRANREVSLNETLAWARSVGITGPSSCVVYIKHDAEPSLVSSLEKALPAKLEKSAPQSHESVGNAERSVRYLQETLAILKQDLLDAGFRLKTNPESLPFITRYIANSHNFHHHVFGGQRTPMQIVCGQDRQPPTSNLLGAIVFAEVPDSVESPSGSRFVVAAFLGYEYASKGCMVSGKVGAENAPKVFRAKSIRILNKLKFSCELCDFLLTNEALDGGPSPSADQQVFDDPELKLRPDAMPKTGPPKAWLVQHGRTPGCYACENKTLHGRVHSAKCKKRYLDAQAAKDSIPLSAPVEAENPNVYPRSRPDSYFPLEQPAVAPAENKEAVDDDDDDYAPSIADTDAMDVDLGEAEADTPMEVGSLMLQQLSLKYGEVYEGVDPEIIENHINMEFCSHFTIDPMMFYKLHGLTSSFDPEKGKLAPFYLPKIGENTTFDSFELGGKTVYLARPCRVFSEDNQSLDVQEAIKGRIVELKALESVKFGKIVSKAEADAFCKTHNIKPIGCRWVVGPKEIEGRMGVRCRMVVQQVAAGNGVAATLGYSSATPSNEAIRALLIHVSSQNWHIGSLDVSTAFMNAALPPGVKVVIRLPNDVSADPKQHQAVFAVVYQALNGLRCASKAWIQLAKTIAEKHNLSSPPTEPCVFQGTFKRGSFSCEMSLVLYVDDVLVGCSDSQGISELREAFLEKVAKIKVTGGIKPSEPGSITFLGREVARFPGSDSMFMRVPPVYLKECVSHVSATEVPPQLELEKMTSDLDNTPLSPEAASKYRSVLGRLAWFCQTRLDLLRYVSILSTGQATPLHKHEQGLNKLLRYVKSNLHQFQEFKPSNHRSLQLFCDASWGVRSFSGYCVFWCGSLLKAVSRAQTAIALSACEAEMVSLTQGCQETIGILHLVGFLDGYAKPQVRTLQDFLQADVEELPNGLFVVFTDSESGQKLLQGDGFNRRTRHLRLAHTFVQRLVYQKIIEVNWLGTDEQIADVLTKILDRVKFAKFRKMMGFIDRLPPEAWQFVVEKKKQVPDTDELVAVLAMPEEKIMSMYIPTRLESEFKNIHHELKKKGKKLVFLELCTKLESGFAPIHKKVFGKTTAYVIQVTKEDDLMSCGEFLVYQLEEIKKNSDSVSIAIWLSPPCTGGSPAQFLSQGYEVRQARYYNQLIDILKTATNLFSHANFSLFEMSRYCQFWKSVEVRKFLDRFEMTCTCYYDRCAYEAGSQRTAKHPFRIQSSVALQAEKICTCKEHLGFSEQNLAELASYPKPMVLEIAKQLCQ